MAKITHIDIFLLNLAPKTKRVDAIQSFISQETPIVRIYDSDGVIGTGYSYTIGTGGHSIIQLIKHNLAPRLIGKDPDRIEHIWQDLLLSTHATSVGAITSLALAAIDTALWDLKCKKANLPLWKAVGGVRNNIPLYSTEGGWLHLEKEKLVEDALQMQARGFKGVKIKIGCEHLNEDAERLSALREKLGNNFEIMTDANQSFSISEAKRRAQVLEDNQVAWFEEPLPADNISAHAELAQNTSVPIAVGESIYSLSQFKDYLTYGAASIIQVDVARIGGITPWLKVAHLAEAYNVTVCPHFLMELHLPLVCGIANAKWLEYIPQLDIITRQKIRIENGKAYPSNQAGLGIDWDFAAIMKMAEFSETVGGAS